MRRLMMSAAAVFLLAVAAAPAVAASEARAGGCWTKRVKVPEDTSDTPAWTYVHIVEWCGDGKDVTSVDINGEFEDMRTRDCKPAGEPVTEEKPENGGKSTFSMGTLFCQTESTAPRQVCPWVIVVVYGDGKYDEPQKDIERRQLAA
jgi:hypothetical protein